MKPKFICKFKPIIKAFAVLLILGISGSVVLNACANFSLASSDDKNQKPELKAFEFDLNSFGSNGFQFTQFQSSKIDVERIKKFIQENKNLLFNNIDGYEIGFFDGISLTSTKDDTALIVKIAQIKFIDSDKTEYVEHGMQFVLNEFAKKQSQNEPDAKSSGDSDVSKPNSDKDSKNQPTESGPEQPTEKPVPDVVKEVVKNISFNEKYATVDLKNNSNKSLEDSDLAKKLAGDVNLDELVKYIEKHKNIFFTDLGDNAVE